VARKGADPPKGKQEAARKLPGPPKAAAGAAADPEGAEPVVAEPPKTEAGVQHERRGENLLLKDAVEYIAALQGTKVCPKP